MIGFLNPLYLLGLIFVSLPILIHLWFRKRLKRVEFSSVKFLYTIERRQFNWLRLREILLLILRTTIIAAIFLSLAHPIVKKGMLGLNRTATLVLLLDDSYSMNYRRCFEDAQAVARRLISRYGPASQFLVSSLSGGAATQFVSRQEALKIVEATTPSFRVGNLKKRYDALAGLLNKAKYQVDLVFITDRQAHTFAKLKEPLATPLKILDVGQQGDNIGIVKVGLKDPVSLEQAILEVRVKNFGSSTWTGRAFLGRGQEKEIVLAGGEEKKLEFDAGLKANLLSGWVRIDQDSLPNDNIRFYYIKPVRPKKILLINQEGKTDKNAAYYVSQALAPAGQKSPFTVEVIAQSLLGRVDFNLFDGIILADLAELKSFAIKKIEKYVKKNTLLILLSKMPSPEFKEFFKPICEISRTSGVSGFLTIDEIDVTHPIFRIFNSREFSAAKFFGVLRIKPHQGKVLMSFDNRQPGLIEAKNLLIFAAGFEPAQTDLVYKPVFVPLMHRLLSYMTQDKMVRDYLVGQPLSMPTNKAVKIVTPFGSEYLVPEAGQVTYDKTEVPGRYEIGGEEFAINVEPEEGNLKKIGTEILKHLNAEVISSSKIFQGSDLAQIFMIICLISLLLEMLLIIIR